jgi:hypothetical protein
MIVPPSAVPAGSSWLVPLADLSLILFVVTGAALAQQPLDALPPRAREEDGRQTGFVQTVPVAMQVDAPGAPPLAQWLATNGRDPTGLVTIEGHFSAPAEREAIAARVTGTRKWHGTCWRLRNADNPKEFVRCCTSLPFSPPPASWPRRLPPLPRA